MRVELLGPPGSGKSTLAPKLAAALDAGHIDMGSRHGLSGHELGDWERWFSTSGSLVRDPRLTAALLPLIRSRATARGALGMPRRELAVLGLASDVCVVVDEGPLQAILWTLMMSGAPLQHVACVARHVSRPDVVVMVTADDAVIADRVMSSGERLLQRATYHEILKANFRYRVASKLLIDALSVPIVQIDCSRDVEVQGVAERIREAAD